MERVTQFFIDLIFQEGSSLRLVPAINIAILALFLLLFVVVFGMNTTVPSIHLVVLSSLALGLLLSVNWFYYEYQKALKLQKEEEEGGRKSLSPPSDKTD